VQRGGGGILADYWMFVPIYTSGDVEGGTTAACCVSLVPESLCALHTPTGTLYSVYGEAFAHAICLDWLQVQRWPHCSSVKFTSSMNGLRTSAKWGFAAALNTYRWLWS